MDVAELAKEAVRAMVVPDLNDIRQEMARLSGQMDATNLRISDLHDNYSLISTRVDRLDGRIDQLGSTLGSRIDQLGERLDNRIDQMCGQLNGRLDQTNGRLDQTNARLDQTNGRLDQMNSKLDVMATRLDEMCHYLIQSREQPRSEE